MIHVATFAGGALVGAISVGLNGSALGAFVAVLCVCVFAAVVLIDDTDWRER